MIVTPRRFSADVLRKGSQLHCLWSWEVSGFAVQSAPGSLLPGRVGQTACPWCMRNTLMWQFQLALHLEGLPHTLCLSEVAAIPVTLSGVGLEVPTWRELMLGTRAPPREPDDYEPGSQRAGWQHEAASRVDRHFRDDVLFTTLPSSTRALIRSQAGPMGGMALSATPTSMLTRIEPHLFRIVLLRRLRQPLPSSARSCRGGRLLDVLGHHRAACARAGFRGQRGFAIESVVARICREAGGRVRTNVMVRDLDMGIPLVGDARRLEVVVDGLPLFSGRQLAVDATLVGALHADGSARPRAANEDGAALVAARRRKEPTRSGCARAAGEIGGRWSAETRAFLSQLAEARSREEIPLMQRRVEHAWRLRWGSMLACASARAVASSLLELRRPHGADGEGPPLS